MNYRLSFGLKRHEIIQFQKFSNIYCLNDRTSFLIEYCDDSKRHNVIECKTMNSWYETKRTWAQLYMHSRNHLPTYFLIFNISLIFIKNGRMLKEIRKFTKLISTRLLYIFRLILKIIFPPYWRIFKPFFPTIFTLSQYSIDSEMMSWYLRTEVF